MSDNQKLEDFEILKKIIKGSVKIEDLDKDLKLRLIKLCDDRTEEITKKIEDLKKKT